ncbi:MAG: leucine-rich repeat protein [Ruminococcus sp.]|nr:leucine-rich repeat protein [Ruminococcus sp.]
MGSVRTRTVSLAAAAVLMFGSAAALPQNAFFDSVSITASAKEGAVIETKDMQYVELADGTLKVIEYIGEGGAVTIPQTVGGQTVTSIGDYAFRNGKNYFKVTSVQMPDTITSIGERAFYMCSKIEKINLSKSLKSIGAHAFGYTSVSEIKLPDGLTSIGESAFEYCTDLTEMAIPGSVKSVGSGAFFYCKNLEKVTIKEGTVRLMSGAFFGCYKLSQVSLPSTLITIGANAFLDNYALKSIDIPKSVTQIGSGAFNRCKALTGITLPESLTSLGSSAFSGCEALKSITIPSGVKEIEDETFKGCSELTGVNLPNTLTSIGSSAFYSCTKLASLIIPDGVKTIGGYAFSDCIALRRVYMPKNLTLVSAGTFRDCRSLLYVNVPEGVTGVMQSAFESCTSLQSVLLPQSLKTIGNDAFVNCTSLKELQVPAAATNLAEYSMGYHYENFKPVKNSGFLMSCVKDSFAQDHAKSYGLGYETVPARTIRLAGSNRYSTAVEISRTGIKRNGAVVLASGRDYADALAGVPFARSIGAPILLTDKDTLPADTLEEIQRLGAGTVYILGGTSAVSTKVENAVKNAGCTVKRISGSSRFGTAAKAAEKLGAPKEIFFVCYNNFADALSVSAAAALKKAPIIYLKKDGALDAETAAYLKSVKGKVANAYVIGGGSVVSDAMMKNAADALGLTVGKTMNRIAGQNRYKTCIEVNKRFASVFTGKNVCIATGADFPDALAGGAFAALDGSPLLLAKDVLASEQTAYLKTLKPQNKYVLGGRAAVPNAIVEKVAAAGK